MKKYVFFILLLVFLSCLAFAHRQPDSLTVGKLEFIQNLGQWNDKVLFKAPLNGAAFFVEKNAFTIAVLDPDQLSLFHESKHNPKIGPVYHVNASSYRMSFIGCNPFPDISGLQANHYRYNYFIDNNVSHWSSNVPTFSSVLYHGLYDGVDLNVYQHGNHLKYDFIVAPHANPNQIAIQYDGLKSISKSDELLLLNTFVSRLVEDAPIAYQILASGDTSFVECHYVLIKNVVTFSVEAYDTARELVIDPTLIFSSYSGSNADNWGYTATFDNDGALYGGGIAFGVGYPVTPGAYQASYCDGSGTLVSDVAISKFNPTGDTLCYATYLGGSFVDIPHSLFVNDNNELYILGTTGSFNFPVNALDTIFHGGDSVVLSTSLVFPHGSDMFVSKLSADGSQLLSSTFIGGSKNDGLNTSSLLRKNYADENRGEIVMDANSNVYVASSTFSSDFPVTNQAFDTVYSGGQDACVFKMNQDLSQLIWSSFLGGSGNDAGYSLSLASDESVYVCGGTTSPDLITSPSAFQIGFSGNVDGFVAHISPNGDQLLHSTYLGKEGYDQGYLIKNDRLDNPYVFGQTNATGYAWIYNASYNKPNGGQFITKLTPSLDTIVWSTTFGTGRGGPDISPTALMVDYCNGIYMSGWGDQSHSINPFGGTSGLDVTSDAYKPNTDGSDFYFICISDDASSLVYASFFGGNSSGLYNTAHEHVDGGTSRFDRKGCIYQAVCAGCGGNSLFPTFPIPGAYSNTNGSGNCNLGVIKMDFNLPVVVADFSMPSTICAPDTVRFVNKSQSIGSATTYLWDFGDGVTSTEFSPSHFYHHAGYYSVTLIVQDNGSGNSSDTLTKNLLVLANSIDTLSTLSICLGDFTQIGLPPSSNVSYSWSPEPSLSGCSISNPIATPTHTTEYTLYASSGLCVDTIHQKVEVSSLQVAASSDTLICEGDSITLWIQPNENVEGVEWSTLSDFSSTFGQNRLRVQVSPNETTTYYVRAVHEACVSVSTIRVYIRKVQIQNAPDYSVCFEPSVQLAVQHDGGEYCQYRWQLDDGSVYETANPNVSPTLTTDYHVTVTTPQGCSAVAVGHILVRSNTFEQPFDAWCDVCEIMEHAHTTIHVTDYGSSYHYEWQPSDEVDSPNSPSTEAHPMVTTVFTVSVTDTFICTKTDTVTITVVPLICDNPFIFIPNTFSPNADGKNDVLYVRSDILEEFYFAVYSRWGQKLFETTQKDSGWDGLFNGKPCQNGVYDYYFKGTCVDGQKKELKGNVMLVR